MQRFAFHLTIAACLLSAGAAFGQSDFYRGKSVRIIVGASAGGGYDMANPGEDRRPPNDEEPDDAPETPPDEPKPVPVQDPPAEPTQPPYVVTGDRHGQQSRTERVDYE